MAFDVVENPEMNAVDDLVGDRSPVEVRRNRMGVPGGPFQEDFFAKLREAELAAPGYHVTLEMGRVELLVDRELPQGRRVFGHVEREPMRFLPLRDRLDKVSG